MSGTGSNRGEIDSLDALVALFGSVQEASRRKDVTTLPPVYQDMVRAPVSEAASGRRYRQRRSRMCRRRARCS